MPAILLDGVFGACEALRGRVGTRAVGSGPSPLGSLQPAQALRCVSLSLPTAFCQTRTEAIKAGFYETEYGKFPKLQILTIAELFGGKQPELPWRAPEAFKKAARESASRRDSLPL
jgi:hypothetical protein